MGTIERRRNGVEKKLDGSVARVRVEIGQTRWKDQNFQDQRGGHPGEQDG